MEARHLRLRHIVLMTIIVALSVLLGYVLYVNFIEISFTGEHADVFTSSVIGQHSIFNEGTT